MKAHSWRDFFMLTGGSHAVGRGVVLAPYGDRKVWDHLVHHGGGYARDDEWSVPDRGRFLRMLHEVPDGMAVLR